MPQFSARADVVDTPTLVELHRMMTRIRLFEERVTREYRRGDIPGFVHTYIGVESVAAGVCAHLSSEDYIASTHRGHGHCIAKGCTFADMLAELYGRTEGLCRGRGGSMHIADFSRGMLGANAIVGGGIALAAGGALASQVRRDGGVAVSFFGDGAANQGVLHEVMNLAAIWRLPLVFVCENNGWAESTPGSYAHSIQELASRANGYGMPGHTVDGTDVEVVYEFAGEAIARARAGEGPTFIEVACARLVGHYLGDTESYRSSEEIERVQDSDPLTLLRSRLLGQGVFTESAVQQLEAATIAELDEGILRAKSLPRPDPAEVERYVYAEAAFD